MKLHWAIWALMTVLTWGLYGAFLHKGGMGFGADPNARMKAFLFVGVAYFVVAIVGPLLIIALSGKGFAFAPEGIKWSLFAGTLGALGALTVLIALNANPIKGPMAASQVMSLVFAGAPIVAAIYGLVVKPPEGGLSALPWQFVLGIVLGATGGALVTLFKPA
jgi:hypothetical protein